MAKIRVYELARELNMTNKVFLEKLAELGMAVSSHVSTLDEEQVSRIKSAILGKKAEAVEMTRVKPTVIRRRIRRVPVEPTVEETSAPPAAEATEPPEAKTVEPAGEAGGAVEKTPPEPDSTPPGAEAGDVPLEGASPEKPLPGEKTQPKETEGARDVSLPKEKKPLGTEEGVEKPKKAKKKKETPAKIIRLPETPKAKAPAGPETPAEPEADSPKPEGVVSKVLEFQKKRTDSEADEKEAEEKDKKKKKGKRESEEDLKDKKFFKKKISFRKKEVVEGADLYAERPLSRKGRKSARGKASVSMQKPQITVPRAIKRRLKIDETIILSDLAKRMGIKAADLIKKLMSLGVMATVNQTVDFETAALVAAEFNYEVEKAAFEEESIIGLEEDDPGKLVTRPPVVTIMGHVDHGKTSLLDTIRKTRVTEGEAGGITQHIGAYNVSTDKGRIVFLDTPGHEAFTAMRARGAKITDLVILVVAADDGVMPQTVEAINHSRAAGVPLIVAVNKIDKPNADPDRIKRQLAELGLVPEAWGGDTVFMEVSAKFGQGIDDLMEMILLQAELLELKANPDKLARGHIIEAKLDIGRGPVATLLVQEGTLRTGESVVCGIHHGKIRAMLNDLGNPITEAGPSMPVEILGLSGVPMAGDEFLVLEQEKSAKQLSLYRSQKQRSKELAKTSRLSLDKLYEQLKAGEVKDLNLIIKADVHGSIEALSDSLVKLSNEEVSINVVHSGTGSIVESDVSLAAVSNAVIIGFNVRATPKAAELAAEENVDIRYYDVIYNVLQDTKDAIVGMMASTFEERALGRAEVREIFHIPRVGTIAGSYVTDGKLERGRPVRLVRDGVVYHTGKIDSLKRFKDDVKEVQTGYECGIQVENYNDIKIGDIIECYYLEEIRPEIH